MRKEGNETKRIKGSAREGDEEERKEKRKEPREGQLVCMSVSSFVLLSSSLYEFPSSYLSPFQSRQIRKENVFYEDPFLQNHILFCPFRGQVLRKGKVIFDCNRKLF
jgi:hypothetical protein